ncbi:hypothetical protein PHMEG_0007839 [Phytophthora megakarya]|uniref:Reverse transcriptase n=1 Tax=Phytophthora megakarya TaxID=4795 RepID=A0A225WL21_9STRA|nr:hypothetical protein PHMEG_0007839 [Phytophthora megakarya]
MFHDGWATQRNCPHSNRPTQIETTEHILWSCSRVKQVWMDWNEVHDRAIQIIWRIWTTSTPYTVWLIRNKENFEDERKTPQEAQRMLWKSTDFQTQAVIRGMSSRPTTRQQAFAVSQCYADFLAMQPSDGPSVLQGDHFFSVG